MFGFYPHMQAIKSTLGDAIQILFAGSMAGIFDAGCTAAGLFGIGILMGALAWDFKPQVNPFAFYQNELAQSEEYLTCVMEGLIGQVELYEQKLFKAETLSKFNKKSSQLYSSLQLGCTTYNCASWLPYQQVHLFSLHSFASSNRPQLHHAATQRPKFHGQNELCPGIRHNHQRLRQRAVAPCPTGALYFLQQDGTGAHGHL